MCEGRGLVKKSIVDNLSKIFVKQIWVGYSGWGMIGKKWKEKGEKHECNGTL